MVRRPVIYGRPLTVLGEPHDTYFTDLQNDQPFADEVTALLGRIVGEDWVSVDVGANIGLVSLALSILAPKGRIYSFEPMPRTAAHLRANVGTRNVEVHEIALGAAKKDLQFFDNAEFTPGSLVIDAAAPLMRGALDGKPPEAFVRVQGTTLDEFVKQHALERLDLIKIDAEGFDVDVLRGAKGVLDRFHPCVIMEFAGFALAMHRNMLPADALTEIRKTFDRVFVLEPDSGWLREIATDVDAFEMLSENAHSRPIQNLFCAYEGSQALEAGLAAERNDRRLAELTDEVERLRSQVHYLETALHRYEESASWRITAPLRRIRRLGGKPR
jgi:FkbM family methyltransferase